MPRLVVRCFAISLDGFSAAPDQRLAAPFGRDGLRLMSWAFATRHFSERFGRPGGEEGIDHDFAVHADDNIGASIMGRNMFGPPADVADKAAWTGWWGPNPPYHHPVFVLTHEEKAPLVMEGGTTFTFVNDGPAAALALAFAAAGGKDVRLAGGPSTVRAFLQAGLIDELHLVQVPVFFGAGDRIFEGLDAVADRYTCAEFIPSKTVSHLRIVRTAG